MNGSSYTTTAMNGSRKPGLLERMDSGEVIIGDGSYLYTLEKRGYVKGSDWTPSAVCEYPDAIKELGLEFSRAGADITQTFTFWSTNDMIPKEVNYTCEEINQAACDIAKSVSKRYGTIVAAGITQTGVFAGGTKQRDAVRHELKCALKVVIENNVDVILVEYFHHIEEMEWAIELALEYGKPVGASMCLGPPGDQNGVKPAECAVRMARAGAHMVGVNCLFDPYTALDTMREMKAALDAEGLKPHLMCQPLGYLTHGCEGNHWGWTSLPEFPYAMESRSVTRWDVAKFAREAYNIGVRYLGGCCGFEPYHIRAIAEELKEERKGKLPEASLKSDLDLSAMKERGGNYNKPNKWEKSFWYDLVADKKAKNEASQNGKTFCA